MTAFRLTVFLSITHLLLGLVSLPGSVHASDVTLRRAATPSGSEAVDRYSQSSRDDSTAPSRRNRLGLSPVPYRPEPSETRPQSAGIRPAGFPDIRELIKKINRSVVSIRMLDGNSKFSLGRLGLSGESGG